MNFTTAKQFILPQILYAYNITNAIRDTKILIELINMRMSLK